MPGNNLQAIFVYYSYEYSVSSKQSDVSQIERVINIWIKVFLPQKNAMNFWWIIKTSHILSTY